MGFEGYSEAEQDRIILDELKRRTGGGKEFTEEEDRILGAVLERGHKRSHTEAMRNEGYSEEEIEKHWKVVNDIFKKHEERVRARKEKPSMKDITPDSKNKKRLTE